MHHETVLTGFGLRLEPLGHQHTAGLAALVDDEMWAGMTIPAPTDPLAMTGFVDTALATPGRFAFAILGPSGPANNHPVNGQLGVTSVRTHPAEPANHTAKPGPVTQAAASGNWQVRGSSSLYDYVPAQQRVELGWTFYGRPWWGGQTNPACKFLLLTHAFEDLGVERVAVRAVARHARSLAAIRKLGAVPEGVLRHHRVAADGSRGDSAYFSILADEWPKVRDGLLTRLQ